MTSDTHQLDHKIEEKGLSVNKDLKTESDKQFQLLSKSTIMMVDDEPINTEMVKMFLEDAGYSNFITIHDSTLAYDVVVKKQPDVILLDLKMPKVSGFDILVRIRTHVKLKHIPVIILTSSTDAETKLRALRLGANDFLGKPVDPSELILRIRNTLAAKIYQDKLAFYDVLTNLPNRRTFINHLSWAIRKAEAVEGQGALIKLDLDKFKEINDTLGPNVGDELLQEVAQRLKDCLRYSDVVSRFEQTPKQTGLCRMGGNEYAVLLPSINHADDIKPIVERVLGVIEKPFHPGHYEIFITASVGISVFPHDGSDVNTLLKHTDISLSYAKEQGGNQFQFYLGELNTKSVERLKLANELRKAVERNELQMYFQPKVNVQNQQIIGAEALMRWIHPSLGMISPAVFIPLAEQINILPVLDDVAFTNTCQTLQQWAKDGIKLVPVSINITSQSFRQGKLIKTVNETLASTGVPTKYIKLELTENTIMENAQENIELLKWLKAKGIKLSIDDFGTGYSSLSYLNRFPIDELKIDQSFIKAILQESSNLSIVKAVIAMATSLDLHVVAEGVETQQQLELLKTLNCSEYQGYFFSKPLPSQQFLELLMKQNKQQLESDYSV